MLKASPCYASNVVQGNAWKGNVTAVMIKMMIYNLYLLFGMIIGCNLQRSHGTHIHSLRLIVFHMNRAPLKVKNSLCLFVVTAESTIFLSIYSKDQHGWIKDC